VTLRDRMVWAQAVLARAVMLARAQGWLAGDAEPIAEPPRVEDVQHPLSRASARLELSEIEVDALWLLACVQIEPVLSRLASSLAPHGEMTVQLLQRILAPATELASERLTLGAIARLVELGLVDLGGTGDRVIRARDRVIDLANGWFDLDRELRGCAELMPSAAMAEIVASAAVVIVVGPRDSGRHRVARAALGRSGCNLIELRCGELSPDATISHRQLDAFARECRLHGAAALLRDIDAHEHAPSLLRRLPPPVAATARTVGGWDLGRPVTIHHMDVPSREARATAWREAMPSADAAIVERAADAFAIAAPMITRVAAGALALASGARITDEHVRAALRAELDHRMVGLASRIAVKQTWDDLVLPPDQMEQLVELVARVRHRHLVVETWGFRDKVGKGQGVSALLAGPPGTGKTMVAGLVANELGLDLYQVDLSRIMSKWIGETEKQLANLFDAAETGHAILLFDEADSLFGRRTEVRSSNDRYANLEVNYLLQRLEAFSGICLLTTNHENAIDEAFRRRLSIHVRFPMPDEPQRTELWRVMLPDQAPRARDIDNERLATEFVMSGGYIKNAAVRAAFLAADEGAPIAMRHLWRAARVEYEAIGKIVRDGVR